jgi:hypothetical protein
MVTGDGLPDLAIYQDRFRLGDRVEAQSGAAERIFAAPQEMDLAALDREQLDLLDDLASTLMGLVSAELLRRVGWCLKPGWAPVETSPSDDLVPVDHAYRLVHEEDERWLYVSEPYPQTAENLARLEGLVERGWHVEVRSGLALHYPGHTLRIQIERAGAIFDPWEAIIRGLPRPT